jgi:predicted AAA+ superfamily ATPase
MKITPDDTLIIFDEIQDCPDAITSLKYFNEKAPEYHIIVAGSLLGLAHHNGTGFPVGKVNFMTLYPLSFLEFLSANGEELLRDAMETGKIDTVETFSSKLIDYLKHKHTMNNKEYNEKNYK